MTMEHIELTHTPGDLRQPLAAADIITMCRRAFGRGTRVESAHELGGGEYNTTYRVRMAGAEPVILRVAPPPGARLFWDERDLMRKEQAIQPYFAPIATLMPRTLLVDFTHQLIDRDYMFQTYMHGERWLEVEHELTPAEDEALWRQFARIAWSIHDVEGDSFGYPYPGPRFPSWSLAVLDIVDRVVSDLEEVGLDTTDILSVRRVVTENRDVFDEITRPRLTHGDLWPFNMLIERGPDGAAIVAVIDADRAWWCDPMADWTAHLFRIKTSPRMSRNRAIYWDEYGPCPQGPGSDLRALVYDGMYTGGVLASATQRNHTKTEAKARDRLRDVTAALQSASPLVT